MAGMKAVEIAKRHDTAAQMRRDRGIAGKPLHGRGYRVTHRAWQLAITTSRSG